MTREELLALPLAAKEADWGQVICNGGPPCFHLEADRHFCLRAKRWPGHGRADHRFVSLEQLIAAILAVQEKEGR